MTIPKIIHQIWIGDKTPPSYMSKWVTMNPDYEYILWDNEKVASFDIKNKIQYDMMGDLYHGKSDILRYEILYKYGGIYLDADCDPQRPLDDFLLENTFFSCYVNEKKRGDRLANGIIGCEKNSKIMSEMIDYIGTISELNGSPFQLVGPIPFTKIYQENKIGTIYPSYYFLPEFFEGEKYNGDFKPYCFHYWGTTNKIYKKETSNNQIYNKEKNGFSIIVTAYQTQEYIEDCLNSIQDQIFFKKNKNYEILLGIDNCSETLDKVKKIIKNYRNLRVFFMLSNMGTYVTSNTLIKQSNYDKIIRFDSDDIMKQDMVTKINEFLGEYDVIRFGFCDFNNNMTNCTKTNYLAYGAIAYKKLVFKQLGGYKNWKCSADLDFINRFKVSYKIYNLYDVIFYRRKHSTSLTSNNTTGINTEYRKKINSQLVVGYEYINPVFNEFIIINPIYELSIIIPTYKNTSFIDECINSVINSCQGLDVEILIGIDSCTETLDYIKNKSFDNRIKFFFFDTKVGPYIIKNSLTKIANSDVILFFDSDDIMGINMIPTIINGVKTNDFIKPMYSDFSNKPNYNINSTNSFGEGVFAIKKDLFLSMNGFEPWPVAADSDFMGRLYKNKKKFQYTNEVVFYRRIHPNSLTQSKETGMSSPLRGKYYSMSKNRTNFGPLPELVVGNYSEINVNHTYTNYSNKISEQVQVKVKVDLSSNLLTNKKSLDYEQIHKLLGKKPEPTESKPKQETPNKSYGNGFRRELEERKPTQREKIARETIKKR